MMGVKLQGVGLVTGVGAMGVAAFVGPAVGVAEGTTVVAEGGAAQAEKVISIKIVIRIVLEFVFMIVTWINVWEGTPLRRRTRNLLHDQRKPSQGQDHQMSPTVNPSGNGSSASTT